MKLNIYASVNELLQSLAEYFVESANHSIKTNGRFTVALSGGSSPEKLYDLLASMAFRDSVSWGKVYFFLGDERYVPLTSEASNFKMINRVLFEPLKINRSCIFAVDTSLAPAEAAAQYMEDIMGIFKGAEPRFDLVLLGLGDNAHTASLFPFTTILQEKEPSIKSVFLKDQQIHRISFTAPLINLAHRVAFLVYGRGKALAVKNILEGVNDEENFPAQLVQPVDGELNWFLDKAAAAEIQPRDKRV